MPQYVRYNVEGGIYFFTIVTHLRRRLFDDALARDCLHAAIAQTREIEPFELREIMLLPDHLHFSIRLPPDDAEFSSRVSRIKTTFTRGWLERGGIESPQSVSRSRQDYRGVWQKRFWEHVIRDGDDLAHCEEYIWFNPVKHGLCRCPHDWAWSSFHRAVREGRMPIDWCCVCDDRQRMHPPHDIPGAEMD